MVKTSALIAACVLGLAACGGGGNSSSSSSSSSPAASSSTTTSASSGGVYGTKNASSSSSAGSTSAVGMYDNYFKSKTISGKAGSTVKITLKNDGKKEHNFKIDSQKQANADVPPGKTATVSVKIPASGSIQFYCEYHKGLGMVGTVKPA